MKTLLFAAATAFLRSFGITFLSFAVGILGASNLSAGTALSISALCASLAAGFRAVQVFVPAFTLKGVLPLPYAAYADAFVRQFLAAFIVGVTGWLAAPNWQAWHAALLGILTGAVVAGVRALQGLLTPGEVPSAATGVRAPA